MATTTIPIQIKTPSGADRSVRSFIVGMTDLIPLGYSGVRLAEQQYNLNLSKWRTLVLEIRKKKSDPLVRWRLGNDMNRIFRLLQEKRGMVVTNQLEALSHDLVLSLDALSFIVRMLVVFNKSEAEACNLGCAKVQQLIGIKHVPTLLATFHDLRTGNTR